jgi:hypothetical protein
VVGRLHVVDLGDFDEIEMLFMGDIHAGDDAHDMSAFLEDIAYLKDTPNAFAFINGDLYQAEGRHTVGVANKVWPVVETRHYLQRVLEPVAHKVVGVNRGNHDARVYKNGCGEDSVDALCASLGLHYFESGEADLCLRFGKSPNDGHAVRYGIYAAHGCSGGRTEGAGLNAVARFRTIRSRADIYVMSHIHDPVSKVVREHYQDLTRGNVVEQQVALVITPSYQKRDGYAIDKNYAPKALGAARVFLDGRFKHMRAVNE